MPIKKPRHPKSTKVEVEERKQAIRQALIQGISYEAIRRVSGMARDTLNWYIRKVRTEDHELMRLHHADMLGAQVIQTIQRLDYEIANLNKIEQMEEALPKDIIEAIKTKIDIYILQVRVLNSGVINNLDDKSQLDRKLGEKPIQGTGSKDGSTKPETKQTKGMVLRKDKSSNKRGGDKLLPKPPGRSSKAPGHNEGTGNDAISDTTPGLSYEEEGN